MRLFTHSLSQALTDTHISALINLFLLFFYSFYSFCSFYFFYFSFSQECRASLLRIA